MVPSVPVTSTYPIRVNGESKLNTLWLTPPSTKLAIADTWVGTCTSNTVPARSPAWMVRVVRLFEPTAATLRHGPEQLHQGGQVVGADVEQRTRTGGEQELRVGVEDVGADVLDHGLRRQRLADVAAGDGPTRGLHPRAEDGVGGHPDQQTRLLGLDEQVAAAGPVHADRLLGPHVLAGGDRLRRDLGVHGRDGQVDHHLHVGVAQHVIGGAPLPDAVLFGPGPGQVDVEVTEDDHVDVGEPGSGSPGRCC